MNKNITFVVPVSDDNIASNNILASPLFNLLSEKEILIQKGFKSAASAYNDAIDKAKSEIIIFLHQDVVLPERWLDDLTASFKCLERSDPSWGVLGCHGETKEGCGRGYLYCTGNGRYILKPFDKPEKIQTLDEIVLIIRKSSDLRFDEALPHFHLYGTDICMTAYAKGMNCYAIPAFCLHNSNETAIFPEEFFVSCDYIREKWNKNLPIYTPCVNIIKNKNLFILKEKYIRTFKYFMSTIIYHGARKRKRLDNPIEFVKKLQAV
jgi:hypothetical protein